ncbi:translation initiation factor IF-2 [Patescibacteria group bacterium]
MVKKTKDKKKLASRPPVVSVLGHIDHGKTTLLDKIRKTKVAVSEAGGITQHIGAYQIEFKDKKITFLDTPGHAAFAKMRARGAKVTDLAILVVAATEGVKPQTVESLKFIKKAKIPFLVAASKIDLPGANIEKVSDQLLEVGVEVEKRGGEVVLVPVSGKTGEGVDDLLEMILLLSELAQISASSKGFKGVVIESSLDRSRGPIATILVQTGVLSLRDPLIAKDVGGKVKAMYNYLGERIDQAFPSQPVKILGFETVPSVGAIVTNRAKQQTKKARPVGLSVARKKKKDKQFSLILKADTWGTLEAVKQNLPKEAMVINQAVGDVNESDILLAQTTNSWVIGFNVRIPGGVKKLAQVEKITIKSYSLIHELLVEVKKEVKKAGKEEETEKVLGEAEVLAKFMTKGQEIAGCRVKSGFLRKGEKLGVIRKQKIFGPAKIVSLKKGNITVDKVEKGEECGVIFEPQLDFSRGDMLVSFRKLPSKE